jgi:hypothetical protein
MLELKGMGSDSGAEISSSIAEGDSFKPLSSAPALESDGFLDFRGTSSGIASSSCDSISFDIGFGEPRVPSRTLIFRSTAWSCSDTSDRMWILTEELLMSTPVSCDEDTVDSKEGEVLRGDGDGEGS